MQTFQERVLKRIADTLGSYGLEPSIDYGFPNIGRLYGHKKGAIAPAVTIGFNFQHPAYGLTITIGSRPIPSQIGRPDYFDFYYENANKKTLFWSCLEAELKRIDDAEFAAIKAKYEKPSKPLA